MTDLVISEVCLKPPGRGGTGALAAFLAGSAQRAGAAHHLVWSLFDDLGGQRPFLYRLHGASASDKITVVSQVPPGDRHDLWDIRHKPYAMLDTLKEGDRIAWALRVNATTRRTGSASRHCIVTQDRRMRGAQPSRTYVGRAESVLETAERVVPPWLVERLAGSAGMEVEPGAVRIGAHRRMEFDHAPGKPQQGRVVLSMTDTCGEATVVDADALRSAVMKGVGAGRAFGCGLLLIRRL